jgi:hypothetical protein
MIMLAGSEDVLHQKQEITSSAAANKEQVSFQINKIYLFHMAASLEVSCFYRRPFSLRAR